jgi:hypothetical protein
MKYDQMSIEGRKRVIAEVDPQVARLAKSLAALQGRKMNEVIETLLREWIANTNNKGASK